MAKSFEERNHQEWLGYIQPVGLVVSTPALLAAQCHVNKNIVPEHQRFCEVLSKDNDDSNASVQSTRDFVTKVFGWRDSDLRNVPIDALPKEFDGLEVVLPEYNETLRPTYVVPAADEDGKPWMMLVKDSTPGHSLDEVEETDNRRWLASPHAKFERLLRETEVPIGLISNGMIIRLVYPTRLCASR